MIAWFARNPVAANLLMVSIILLGMYSLLNETAVEIFPSSEPETIQVTVPLRGATPEDAELGLAARIEEALEGLEGIDQLTTNSVEGSSTAWIEIDADYDPQVMLDEIKTRVDAINTFPVEAEKPIIRLAVWKFGVITVAVSGDLSESELREFATGVREDLLRMPEISQASLDAIRSYEISIEASQNRLREYNLTLADIATAIRNSSIDLSAGNVRAQGGDVLIRSKGQAYRRAQFEDIVVKTNADGSILRLSDIAAVNDGFTEDLVTTRFDGRPAALINVERVGKESALEISALVKEYIDGRQATLPQGVTLGYWDDDAQQLKNRLGVLGSSALQGTFLVILLLTLFLRPKIAIWVFIGIPISFLGAFSIMSLFGISLNLMSAFGFIVVLGIVVDDAIVTGESVYRRLKMGDTGVDASINGTMDVAVPVTFGVLTTMVAFIPLTYMEGRFGNIMGPVAAVVCSVLLFSLIESKLVLPAHLNGMGKGKDKSDDKLNAFARWQQNFADGFERSITRYYRPALALLTEHRYATLVAFVGTLFVIFALVSSGWLRFTFFPSIQGETATATLQMPVGTPYEVTDRYVQRMFQAAESIRAEYVDEETGDSAVRHILASSGSRWGNNASHYGRVQIELVPPEKRTLKLTTNEIVQEWRSRIGEIPGSESLTFRSNFFRVGDPIDIQLRGNDIDTLSLAADQIKEHLATYPTVFEIADSLSDGKQELQIELTEQGHVLGLTRSSIVSQVSQAFRGFEAQRIQRGRDDIRVLVRLPYAEREDINTLQDLLISTPNGQQVPLDHVARLIPGKGPQVIKRIDRYRTVNITAEVDKTATNMTVLQRDIRGYLDGLVQQYPGVRYSLEGEAREQRESFGSLYYAIIIVLFAIYCMLALPLKSYVKPLIVMSVIPFGVIGAVAGHFVMGYNLSMMSVLGILALTGVIVNDSLVLVHAVGRQRDTGETFKNAVLNAGVIRFRPIILTSLTTFFGLMPLMLEKSTTSQFLIPMGISLGFGILFATLITLVLVPVNMMVANDIRNRVRGYLYGKPTGEYA